VNAPSATFLQKSGPSAALKVVGSHSSKATTCTRLGGFACASASVAPEQTGDPVRIYLREMGVVPLLTREGEVDIAKRIERGQLRVLKALSRSPIVIREVLAIGEDLKRGVRSIKEIVVFDEEEITEKVLQNRVKDTTHRIDELQKHYKRACQLAVRLQTISAKKESTRMPPLPMQAGPRDRSNFAHHPQPRFHQLRAQTPDR
jgi:hypothetical protein